MDGGNIGEGLFRLIGVVERGARGTSQAFGDASGEERNSKVSGYRSQQVENTLLFAGFDGDNRAARIDQQA
jgi:hypothetical protein